MKALHLLKQAALLYDDPATNLAARVNPAGGFQSGADWMRETMSLLRGRKLPGSPHSFTLLGIAKYTMASVAALLVVASVALGLPWPAMVILAPLAFYAVEVQFVFLFPLVIDGVPRPWRRSLRMTRFMTTPYAMSVVIPLAAVMLFGGLFGKGFIRCWCLGCLSVVIWYEEERIAFRHLPSRMEHVSGDARLKLLWVTDLHLRSRTVTEIAARLVRTARRLSPTLIVLGGDIVEDSGSLPKLGRLLRALSKIAPTHVFPGNHDHRAGMEAFRKIVEKSPAHWHSSPGFAMKDGAIFPIERSASLDDCLIFVHDPGILDQLNARWLAAFAGHLHGGQVVLWRNGQLEYPGAWLSHWNGPRMESSKGTVIVSRGITDTLPLRWNCPKEVILCEIC